MFTGTLLEYVLNASSFIMFEKNTTCFIANTVATSSASMVDCAVSPCIPNLKLTRLFEKHAG